MKCSKRISERGIPIYLNEWNIHIILFYLKGHWIIFPLRRYIFNTGLQTCKLCSICHWAIFLADTESFSIGRSSGFFPAINKIESYNEIKITLGKKYGNWYIIGDQLWMVNLHNCFFFFFSCKHTLNNYVL